MNEISDLAMWNHYQLEHPESFVIGHSRQDMLFNRVRGLISSGQSLEIGFGDAYLLRRMAAVYDCHGADLSREYIEQIAPTLPNVAFAVIEDGRLPYPDDKFDIFIASEVLEHMDDEQLATAVAEMRRLLKVGGHAIVTFPAREALEENECFCPSCGTTFHKWGHKQRWDSEKIRRIFSEFSIERIEEKYFLGPQLNAFGRLEAFLRIALSKIRAVSGMTFVVTLRK